MDKKILYEWTVTAGGMWSKKVKRGKVLKITDLEGGLNVGMLLYNAQQPLERYNMPDTLKGQHTFYVTSPLCLHSDMGHIMASVTEDSLGWHDTVCGAGDSKLVSQKYGTKNYQEAGNEFYRNARDSFLIEMAKWGLGERDLVPNLNLFSKVVADEDGGLNYIENHSQKGDFIKLRFEMDTLVVLNTSQHPLDSAQSYAPKPAKLEVYEAGPVAKDDPCRISRPQNEHAFQHTENDLKLWL